MAYSTVHGCGGEPSASNRLRHRMLQNVTWSPPARLQFLTRRQRAPPPRPAPPRARFPSIEGNASGRRLLPPDTWRHPDSPRVAFARRVGAPPNPCRGRGRYSAAHSMCRATPPHSNLDHITAVHCPSPPATPIEPFVP